MGNFGEFSGVGQPDFSPFLHTPCKGVGNGKSESGEIPTEQGAGKEAAGKFEPIRLLTAEQMAAMFGPHSVTEEIAELLTAAAKLVRSGHLESSAWRVADAAGLLVRKIAALGLDDVPGVHERTGRGSAIYLPEPEKCFTPVEQGGRTATALYRHFDANDRLLYVGISLSAVQRLAQHRHSAHWFKKIVSVGIEWFPSREAAIEAEAAAIQLEKPLHNIALNGRTSGGAA